MGVIWPGRAPGPYRPEFDGWMLVWLTRWVECCNIVLGRGKIKQRALRSKFAQPVITLYQEVMTRDHVLLEILGDVWNFETLSRISGSIDREMLGSYSASECHICDSEAPRRMYLRNAAV